MSSLMTKPIENISVDDIDQLIDDQVSENEQIEFKLTLPASKIADNDPWIKDQSKIGNFAKEKILEEVVAFANAYGGVLIVGVEESDNGRRTATSIQPLPKCEELADRFKKIFQHQVEPMLPTIEIRGVLTQRQEGVLFIRVGKSRSAPHRVKPSKKCTIRHQDSCVELSMREIQDLTLNTTRGLDRVEKKLKKRKEKFEKEFDRLTDPTKALGVRVTGLPIDEIRSIEKVYENGRIISDFSRPVINFLANGKPNREINYSTNFKGLYDPVLRGARERTPLNGWPATHFTFGEVHCDGLVELGLLSTNSIFAKFNFDPDIAVGFLAHLLEWIKSVRESAFSVVAEYAIQVQLRNRNTNVEIGINNHFDVSHSKNSLCSSDSSFTDQDFDPYSFGVNGEFDHLIRQFRRDFFNFAELDVPSDNEDFKLTVS